jgi:hypothetical protein
LSDLSYNVFAFDEARLAQCFIDGSHNSTPFETADSQHLKYLAGYLSDLAVKTLVVEYRYVDRDFLEDYAAYYVRCFPRYKRTCTRLHCFTAEFNEEDFRRCILRESGNLSIKSLQGAYRGFIVIKPLPQTIIGKTCLSVYGNSGTRQYPAATRVDAHLFGIPLTIDQTLPFQQQDGVVAACATSALWSVFYATAQKFQHQLLTPVEITKSATRLLPAETRVIPNHGLSIHQMAHAIRSVDLEPMLARVSDRYLLQAIVYAYLRARIPMILGVDLIEEPTLGVHKPRGKHAVAISGYHLGSASSPAGGGPRLTANRIDKLYAHDDQIGPFARMELSGTVSVTRDGKPVDTEALTTSWPCSVPGGRVIAIPDMLLCPMYHKVRIEWKWVLLAITELNLFLATLSQFGAAGTDQLEWDVYLTNVNDVKRDYSGRSDLTPKQRFPLLTQSMPRFLWRATGRRNNTDVVDVLFDATDIETGQVLVSAVAFDPFLQSLLQAMVAHSGFASARIRPLVRKIITRVAEL